MTVEPHHPAVERPAKRNRNEYHKEYQRALRARRRGSTLPPTPHESRRRATAADWAQRLQHLQTVGMYPDRLRGLDDRELVRAMRAERRSHG